jgi:hypothetical protein
MSTGARAPPRFACHAKASGLAYGAFPTRMVAMPDISESSSKETLPTILKEGGNIQSDTC